MGARLVADMLRRTPVATLLFVPGAVLAAWSAGARPDQVQLAMAVSLGFAYLLGPIALVNRLQTPLIPYLPVSRRDVWRARWLMSTIAPAALVSASTLVVTLLTGASTWSSLTLSASMNVLYAGAGCALVALGRTSHGTRLWVRNVTSALLVLGILFPMLIRSWLPLEWHGMDARRLLMLAGAAALTAWGALHTPSMAQVRTLRSRPAPSTGIAGPASGDWRLSGLPRLVARELGQSLMLLLIMLCMVASMEFFFGRWLNGDATTMGSLVTRLFFFDRGSVTPGGGRFDVVSQWGWSAFYAAAVFGRFPQMLRHLRVLPIGTARLLALLLGWPALVWGTAWLLLLLTRLALTGPPAAADYRWLLLFAGVGLSSLGMAVRLRFARMRLPGVFAGMPLVVPFWQIFGGSSVWLIAIGLLSLGLAAVLNVSALSRNTTYQHPDPFAGVVRGT